MAQLSKRAAAPAVALAIGWAAPAAWAAEGASPGMPQLNVGDFAPQVFWLAATFVALYLVMSRYALPRLGGVIEAREQRIAHDLDRAAQLNSEAEEVKEAYESALAQAHARASGLSREVEVAAAGRAAAAHGGLSAELAERIKTAEARIAAARDAAMGNVATVAAESARLAAERLAGLAVSTAEAERAARHVLAERRGD